MSSTAHTLVVHGAGRMGEAVVRLAEQYGFEVIGVVSRTVPTDWTVPVFETLAALPVVPDLVVDFTLPTGLREVANWCGRHHVPLVSGTTGLDDAARRALGEAAESTAVLHAANFCPGVNLLRLILREHAGRLPSCARIKITDTHHAGKLDAPSGTALRLAEDLVGHEVPIESHREGDVVGRHDVTIQWADERLVLSHEATDRAVFARGALDAGNWLMARSPGLYEGLDWAAAAHG